MKLAILLWVYKDIAVSIDRARWLRRLDPGLPLYCLYDGPPEQAGAFDEALAPLTDDFYAYTAPVSAYDKWLHADRLLAAWHDERGRELAWDSVFVAQWGLVLTAPVARMCGSLGPGEVLFSSTRPIAEVAHFWSWLKPGSQHLADYTAFAEELRAGGLLPAEPLCCNLIAAVLPRAYLDRYVAEASRSGFSEYKMTMLAQAWGFAFCRDHALDASWVQERAMGRVERHFVTMHGEGVPVHRKVLALNALWPWGHRAFHPYTHIVPAWVARLPWVRHHQAAGRAVKPARSSIARAASSTPCSSSARPMI